MNNSIFLKNIINFSSKFSTDIELTDGEEQLYKDLLSINPEMKLHFDNSGILDVKKTLKKQAKKIKKLKKLEKKERKKASKLKSCNTNPENTDEIIDLEGIGIQSTESTEITGSTDSTESVETTESIESVESVETAESTDSISIQKNEIKANNRLQDFLKTQESTISNLPNYMELSLSSFDVHPQNVSIMDVNYEAFQLKYEPSTDKEDDDINLNHELFIKYIKDNYEVVETIQLFNKNQQNLINEDRESSIKSLLLNFEWDVSGDHSHQSKGCIINNHKHTNIILLRKKIRNSIDQKYPVNQSHGWNHQFELEMSLSDAIFTSKEVNVNKLDYNPTIIFVEEKDAEFVESINIESNLSMTKYGGKLATLKEHSEYKLHNLDDVFIELHRHIFVKFNMEQSHEVADIIKKFSENDKYVDFFFIDRDSKSTLSTFRRLTVESTFKRSFHLFCDNLKSVPLPLRENVYLTLNTCDIENIERIKERYRVHFNTISLYKGEGSNIKFIPTEKFESIFTVKYQSVESTIIVAKDHDEYFELAKELVINKAKINKSK